MKNNYNKKQKKLIQKIKSSIGSQKDGVQIQSDYVDQNDDRLCLSSLTFIPPEIGQKISQEIIEPLKKIDPDHYYYPPESLHLTIKNIRIIHKPPRFNKDDVVKADKLFQEVIPKFKSFSFDLQGLMLFPKTISLIGYSNETLGRLVKTLDAGLKNIGLLDDKEYFSDEVFFGNITLCRFKGQPKQEFIAKVKELENISIGKFLIREVNLVVCNLVCNSKTRRIIGTYYLG